MATVRFDPPEREKRSLGDVAGTFVKFFTSPLGTSLGGVTQSHPKSDATYGMLPVEVDTSTGQVRVVPADTTAKGKQKIIAIERNKEIARVEQLLAAAYATGQVQGGLPAKYVEVGKQIANLQQTDPIHGDDGTFDDYEAAHTYRARPVKEEPSTWETNDMGGFIPPGGMAGFSQMTGASKLALTRLARGTRRSKRSGKRRKSTAKRKKTTKRRSPKSSRRRKLVKGSAAAKRFMANLRRKRK